MKSESETKREQSCQNEYGLPENVRCWLCLCCLEPLIFNYKWIQLVHRGFDMRIFKLALIASLLPALAVTAQAQNEDYFEKVLNIIESRALKSPMVNWTEVRSRSRSMVSNVSRTSDTYPAIACVLSQLRDNHSFLKRPDGSTVPIPGRSNNSSARNHVTTRRSGQSRILQSGRYQVGYIVVGSIAGGRGDYKAMEYCRQLRSCVSTFRNAPVKAWIVDLRGNGGGNMWPMIVGIGQIIGAGTLGYFEQRDGSSSWFYRQGRAGIVTRGNEHELFNISDGRSDFSSNSPIAVLIDAGTASSGEAVAISFRGRPNVRFFGEETSGLSTGNETIPLSDGASLYLTTSVEADRNKHVYTNGIIPDTIIQCGNIPLGDPNDPVIRIALKWIDSR